MRFNQIKGSAIIVTFIFFLFSFILVSAVDVSRNPTTDNVVGVNMFIPESPITNLSYASTNMFLKEDMLRLNPIDTNPELCLASNLGAIYFDISEDDMCVCKATGWKVMTDGTDCT